MAKKTKMRAGAYYFVCEGKTPATLQVSEAVVKFIKDHKPKIVTGSNILITRIREVNANGSLLHPAK